MKLNYLTKIYALALMLVVAASSCSTSQLAVKQSPNDNTQSITKKELPKKRYVNTVAIEVEVEAEAEVEAGVEVPPSQELRRTTEVEPQVVQDDEDQINLGSPAVELAPAVVTPERFSNSNAEMNSEKAVKLEKQLNKKVDRIQKRFRKKVDKLKSVPDDIGLLKLIVIIILLLILAGALLKLLPGVLSTVVSILILVILILLLLRMLG